MSATLLVMSDGRGSYLRRTIESARAQLQGDIAYRVIHEDSGDPLFADWVEESFPDFYVHRTRRRSGFGGAILSAWNLLGSRFGDASHVFHLEGDFLFNRPVDLDAMAAVLTERPHIVQVALRRQPWNAAEVAAGGVVEMHPAEYVDTTDGVNHWLEHRMFFTTNPSLYRMSLLRCSWPSGPRSEGRFSLGLCTDGTPEAAGPDVRFAYWGERSSGEWVEHIGAERAGRGY